MGVNTSKLHSRKNSNNDAAIGDGDFFNIIIAKKCGRSKIIFAHPEDHLLVVGRTLSNVFQKMLLLVYKIAKMIYIG